MTSIQSQIKLTLAEFLQQPETKPASEYISGRIYQKPMSKRKHSALQNFLSSAINQMGIPQRIARAFTEIKQNQDILAVLSSLGDLQLSVQDVCI